MTKQQECARNRIWLF